ncbi:MAG: hypothetical protein AAB909_03195 [Patescibacteria group bacterium]
MKKAFVFFFTSLLFLALATIITGLSPRVQTKKSSGVITILGHKAWSNCSSFYHSIIDNSRNYYACQGGVQVTDKANRVVDQITMADGLSNQYVNSLVKKDNTLYIGTQDGVTVFDLITRQAKKISVKEGLVNGSNILVKEDGDYIWVGTFNGVSKIDTRDLSIQNFTSELGPSPIHNVRNILVTPSSVYFVYVAGGDSTGGIARYDKFQNSWTHSTASDFISNSKPKDRLDFSLISEKDDNILVGDTHETWQSLNAPGNDWSKVETPSFSGYPQPGTPILLDRPLIFDSLLAAIDSHLFFASGNEIWKLNLQDLSFSQALSLPLEVQSNILFIPILGSSQIFIYGQSCGMGCGEPKMYIYDYSNSITTPISLPSEIDSSQTDYPSFLPLFESANIDLPLRFAVSTIGVASLDPVSLAWSSTIEGIQPPLDEQQSPYVPQFTFSTTGSFDISAVSEISDIIVPEITMVPEKYSPFGWPDKVRYQPSFLIDDLVWTGSNRGLKVFSPNTGRAQLISTSDGLTSNQIIQYLILSKHLIVRTNAGLSVIQYR